MATDRILAIHWCSCGGATHDDCAPPAPVEHDDTRPSWWENGSPR